MNHQSGTAEEDTLIKLHYSQTDKVQRLRFVETKSVNLDMALTTLLSAMLLDFADPSGLLSAPDAGMLEGGG